MNNFDIKNYYQSLMEQLLQCTEDDFGLLYFYNFYPDSSEEENKVYLYVFSEFIYRCLKCNLLKTVQDIKEYNNGEIKNLNYLVNLLLKFPFNKKFINYTDTEVYIWYALQVCATELLDNIAKDCDLVAYEDDVDFSTEKGRKFKDKIEKVWADHGLPWDLTQPLFPVP